MYNVIFISAGLFLIVLFVSAFLTVRSKVFDKQYRDYSQQAVWYEIQAQNESDLSKSLEYMRESERLKSLVEKMLGQHPRLVRYELPEPTVATLTPQDCEALKDMSLGETLRFYAQRNAQAQNVVKVDFSKGAD